jgi:hypothetical protein
LQAGRKADLVNDFTLLGSHFDMLRAVSSVERLHPVPACGRQGRGASLYNTLYENIFKGYEKGSIPWFRNSLTCKYFFKEMAFCPEFR